MEDFDIIGKPITEEETECEQIIQYDKAYYDNLKEQHISTAEQINKKRWKFVESVPFETVLDYGCGCGELTEYAPDGIVVDSYDIGKLNGESYPQTGINHDHYDLVFFNDVLEHIDWLNNPDNDIEKILKIVKYVCISIPLWEYDDGNNIKEWKHYKPKEHLTYFDYTEITQFFRKRGFREIIQDTNECPPRENIFSAIYKQIIHPPQKNKSTTIISPIEKQNKKRKIILKQKQSPGDILTFTRSVTDLKLSYPEWDIDVKTPANEIFENCPHITHLDEKDPEVEVFNITYPDINISGWNGLHYSDAFRNNMEEQLGVKIVKTGFKPELWISDEEKGWINQVEAEFGWKGPFWLLNAGQKPDNDLKYYYRWQEVVDLLNFHFADKVKIIQIGHSSHKHKKLEDVLDLVGKTDIRQLIRLAYWSEGLVGPLSFQFVLAAALEKPGVVVAGGKEGVNWHIYPHIRHICTNGTIDCCKWDGCWKSKKEDCLHYSEDEGPLCYSLIKPHMIAESVLMYYEGKILSTEKRV
jgi:ADP-heptose:LPS heptosyltransferase